MSSGFRIIFPNKKGHFRTPFDHQNLLVVYFILRAPFLCCRETDKIPFVCYTFLFFLAFRMSKLIHTPYNDMHVFRQAHDPCQ
jgi:hypothetical protein